MNQPATAARTPFQPTAPMIQAAEDLFLAMAFEQSVRPIVEGYQRKILAERTWHVAPNMLDQGHVDDARYRFCRLSQALQ
jgi:hypothetical protein